MADDDYIGFGNTKRDPYVIGVEVRDHSSPCVSYQEKCPSQLISIRPLPQGE